MAKKADVESTAKTPRRKVAGNENSLARRTGEGRGEGDVPRSRERERVAQPGEGRGGKPSRLLDTRVVYCGDNLEQLGPWRTGQRDSALRTPPSAFVLAGSFYYHCDWHASHYVKVKAEMVALN